MSLIKQSRGRRLSMSAHIVHLGLVLLIIGHLLSTTIVDRGDASHRVTLIRDEAVIFEGYELIFVEDNFIQIPLTVFLESQSRMRVIFFKAQIARFMALSCL